MAKKPTLKQMTTPLITDSVLNFLSYMPNPDDVAHGSAASYETQLTEFPLGAFDDLCDGLWLGLQAAQKAGSGKITMSTVKRTARSVANKVIGRVR